MNLTNFQQFINIFPIKIFQLVSYSMLMIGIRQFFTHQNFPNPDSSKFSTVKILCHTVVHGGWSNRSVGNCSELYDSDLKNKTRSCSNPVPSCGGINCVGEIVETVECNTLSCKGL